MKSRTNRRAESPRPAPHSVSATRGPVAVPEVTRTLQGPLTPQTLFHVQRTLGNQAALRLLGQPPLPVAQRSGAVTVIQREYTPSTRQKGDLKKALAKWKKAFEADGGDDLGTLADELAAYCDGQRQALTIIDKATYQQWQTASLKGVPAEAFENQLLGIGEDVPKAVAKATDPLDAVRKKIAGKGWDLGLFGVDDLRQIDTNKAADGWEKALTDTYLRLVKAKQDADLKAKLLLEYAADKALGDLRFTTNILSAVWNLSHLIATSPNAGINTTVGGEYSDADIYAAANVWHATASMGLVTDFHVPGGSGNGRIEDKSTRLVNADPTRGRQCDFISHWKGNKINVHVNSDQHH